MQAKRFWLGPIVRGVLTLYCTVIILICQNILLLTTGVLIVYLALLVCQVQQVFHKFLIAMVFPLFVGLFLIWGIAANQVPIAYFNQYPYPALNYALLIAERIALLGGIYQLCFLPLMQNNLLIQVLKTWRIKGRALTLCIATISMLENLHNQFRQVWQAQLARGHENRHLLDRVKSLPMLLRPIFINILYSAIKRSELWQHRQLVEKSTTVTHPVYQFSVVVSSMVLILIVAYSVLVFYLN